MGADHVTSTADLNAEGTSIKSLSNLIIKNAVTDNTVFEVTNAIANNSKIETALLSDKAISLKQKIT